LTLASRGGPQFSQRSGARKNRQADRWGDRAAVTVATGDHGRAALATRLFSRPHRPAR